MHIAPVVPGSGCFKLSCRIRVSKVHVRVRVCLITVSCFKKHVYSCVLAQSNSQPYLSICPNLTCH